MKASHKNLLVKFVYPFSMDYVTKKKKKAAFPDDFVSVEMRC